MIDTNERMNYQNLRTMYEVFEKNKSELYEDLLFVLGQLHYFDAGKLSNYKIRSTWKTNTK